MPVSWPRHVSSFESYRPSWSSQSWQLSSFLLVATVGVGGSCARQRPAGTRLRFPDLHSRSRHCAEWMTGRPLLLKSFGALIASFICSSCPSQDRQWTSDAFTNRTNQPPAKEWVDLAARQSFIEALIGWYCGTQPLI